MRWLGMAMVGWALAVLSGCSTDPSGSQGTGAGGDAAAGGAIPAGGSGGLGAGGSGGTSTGGGGQGGGAVPCDPLVNADDPNPTEGSCAGNVAITCGEDGFLESEPCVAGLVCQTYELDEWRFDSVTVSWIEGRKVTWAGCLPPDAAECEMVFNDHYYEAVEATHCEGVNKVACRLPPAPQLFSNTPQLQLGTTAGWLEVSPCPAGEKCAGSNTVGVLTCIDESTPACDGSEPFCDAGGVMYCYGTWESPPGYRTVEPCTGGQICYEGSSSPFCNSPGEVPCDVSSFSTACTAALDAIVSCYDGWTHHQSCVTCSDGAQQVPCRCDDLIHVTGWSGSGATAVCSEQTLPLCVPQAMPDCDPTVDQDHCVGNVAHRCVGHWSLVDCAAEGLVCDTAAERAGCRAAQAAPCPNEPFCDGTEVVACCSCGTAFLLDSPEPPPCVPGFEVRSDCADWGSSYQCVEDAGFAECR